MVANRYIWKIGFLGYNHPLFRSISSRILNACDKEILPGPTAMQDQQLYTKLITYLAQIITYSTPYPFKPPSTLNTNLESVITPLLDVLTGLTMKNNANITPYDNNITQNNINNNDIINKHDDNKRLLRLSSFHLHRVRDYINKPAETGIINKYDMNTLNTMLANFTHKESTPDNNHGLSIAAKIDQILSLLGYGCTLASRGVRMLTLDGGGIRGIVALELLIALEEALGRPLRDCFDIVYGTSTGSIIIFMHFICKIPLSECLKLYKQFSQHIFIKRSTLAAAKQLWSTHSLYDVNIMRDMLLNYPASELQLWETQSPGSRHRVGLVSTVVADCPSPYIFRNYRIPSKSRYQGECTSKWVDSILASCAAPGFFPDYTIHNRIFQDGGLVANNPSAIAFHESRLLWPDHTIQCLVSVGTGAHWIKSFSQTTPKYTISTQQLGVLERLKVLMYCITSSSHSTHDVMSEVMPIMNIPYFRLDPVLPREISLYDSGTEEIDLMVTQTRNYINTNMTKLNSIRDKVLGSSNVLHKCIRYYNLIK